MITLLQTKALLKLGLAVVPLAAAGAPITYQSAVEPRAAAVETVTVAPGAISYRVAGEFSREGKPVDAPLLRLRREAPLEIMKAQVSEADYARCVAEGACRPLSGGSAARADFPVTGVSWDDASAYAHWLSARTGETWRLPTDAEWVFAAGSRAADEAVAAEAGDFTKRWLAKYDKEAGRDRSAGPAPRKTGSFGRNEHGLLDLAGNVWEWTDTCYVRTRLDGNGATIGTPVENCGVRAIQGAHRTYGSTFVRDPRGGGCTVGAPPDNLGFRLVREAPSWLERVVARARKPFGGHA